MAALPIAFCVAVAVLSALPDDDLGITLLLKLICLVCAAVTFAVVLTRLRRITGNVAEASDEVIDEREI